MVLIGIFFASFSRLIKLDRQNISKLILAFKYFWTHIEYIKARIFGNILIKLCLRIYSLHLKLLILSH